MVHTALRHRWPTRLLVVAVLVGAADFLFFDRRLGCTAAIYVALLVAGILVSGVGSARRRSVGVLTASMVGMIVALLEEPAFLTLMMSFVGLTTLALTQRHGWTPNVVLWMRRCISFWKRGTVQWARDLRTVVRSCDIQDVEQQRMIGLRRWLPALGLGVVFLALFAIANPVLAGWMESLAGRAFNLGARVDAPRVLFWIVMAIGAWAALRARAARIGIRQVGTPPSLVSGATLVRSLIVFNLLFLLQNELDVRHLMLDAALPEGVTYSQYARRGAYPLLAAALLSAAFVLTTFRSEQDTFGRGARRLTYAFLAQNVVLTAFAMLRLSHYVDAYALTRIRLAAFLWMGLVAVGLALIFVRIVARRDTRWLLGANALAAVTLLYACCFPNWDRFIADYNVARCKEVRGYGRTIDLEYLRELGTDALPALRRLQQEATDPQVRDQATRLGDATRAILDEQLAEWRGWTLRRARLHAADIEKTSIEKGDR